MLCTELSIHIWMKCSIPMPSWSDSEHQQEGGHCKGLGTHMASDASLVIALERWALREMASYPKADKYLLVVVIFHCDYFKRRVWADAYYKTKEWGYAWPILYTNSLTFLNQKIHWIPLTFWKFFCKRCPLSASKPWRRMGSRKGKGIRGWFLSEYLGLAPHRGAGPGPLENIPAGALTFCIASSLVFLPIVLPSYFLPDLEFLFQEPIPEARTQSQSSSFLALRFCGLRHSPLLLFCCLHNVERKINSMRQV